MFRIENIFSEERMGRYTVVFSQLCHKWIKVPRSYSFVR